ncbi:MAG TPA: hypothetical protein P5079_11125, partial [Elusimicrobiota bacterium]|nr:hypothetical protein [Elusimicrobiota bacterium]
MIAESREAENSVFRLLERVFLRPLPHTPSFTKNLPSWIFLRRVTALTTAVIVFYSQVVCAGTSFFPTVNLPFLKLGPRVESLMDRLNQWASDGREVFSYVMHASVYEDRQKLLNPGAAPDTLLRQEERQKANMDLQQINQQNRGMQLPSILKQPGDQRPEGTLKDIKLLDEGVLPGDQVSDAIQREIEEIRSKNNKLLGEGAEFKYQPSLNFDGTLRVTYFKNGNVSSIENARYRNPHGQTIIQNV